MDGLDVTGTGVRGAKTDARLQTLALRNSLCSSERWVCVIIKNTADKCCDSNYGRQRHPWFGTGERCLVTEQSVSQKGLNRIFLS